MELLLCQLDEQTLKLIFILIDSVSSVTTSVRYVTRNVEGIEEGSQQHQHLVLSKGGPFLPTPNHFLSGS